MVGVHINMNSSNPRLECVYFGTREYIRLAKVLELSAKTYLPNWDINVRKVDGHSLKAALSSKYVRKELFPNNAHKALEWSKIVQSAEEGDRILLIDADTFIRSPLDEIWNFDFDYARTVRDYKWPWNSGVMFLRINERTKKLFELITKETFKMLNDAAYHEVYEEQYGGIHQAATSAVIERNEILNLHVLDIPCKIWNAEHTSRTLEDLKYAKIVHLLPSGRKKLLKSKHWTQEEYWLHVGREWYNLDAQIPYGYRWSELVDRLEKLHEELGGKLKIAEIGVWEGDTVKQLLKSPYIQEYHLIDPWEAARPDSSWYISGSKLAGYTQGRFDQAFKKAIEVIKNDRDRVKIHRKKSLDIVGKFEDHSLDLVFIDGDHSYQGVSDDIKAWLPKIKFGGYIGGHDFDEPRFSGVREAVEENFNMDEIELGDDYTWFYRVPDITKTSNMPLSIFRPMNLK